MKRVLQYHSASSTLQLPVLQTNNGPPLVGLVTIACHLTLEAKRPELLGDSAESRAVVQQWLEHRVTRLDGCRKEEVKSLLKVALVIHCLQSCRFILQNYVALLTHRHHVKALVQTL